MPLNNIKSADVDNSTAPNASYAPTGDHDCGVTELLAELAKDVPFIFVAVTVNVYAVPSVRPVTVIGLDEPVAVILPGFEDTVYVADAPPVAPGVNATDADADPAVTSPIVGACGIVVAVTPDEAELAEDVPVLFVAVATYVYCVLEASPVTIIGLPVPVNVAGDVVGVGVIVYVAGKPNVSVAGVKATDALPLL